MLKAHRAKLEDIAKSRPFTNTREQPQTSRVAEFRASLMAGQRRELEILQLDIRFHEARLQATRERLNILALEETRFILQCLYQQIAGSQKYVRRGDSHDEAVQTVALNLSRTQNVNRRFSYLESYDREILGRVCELAFSKTDIEIVKFAYQPRRSRSLRDKSRTPAFPPIQVGVGQSLSLCWYGPTRLNSYYCYGSRHSIYDRVNTCLRLGGSYSIRCDWPRLRSDRFCDSFRGRRRSASCSRRFRARRSTECRHLARRRFRSLACERSGI